MTSLDSDKVQEIRNKITHHPRIWSSPAAFIVVKSAIILLDFDVDVYRKKGKRVNPVDAENGLK